MDYPSSSSSSPKQHSSMGIVMGYILAGIFLIVVVVLVILYIRKPKSNGGGGNVDCSSCGNDDQGVTCGPSGCQCAGKHNDCLNCNSKNSPAIDCQTDGCTFNGCSSISSLCPTPGNDCTKCQPEFSDGDISTWVDCPSPSKKCTAQINILKDKTCHEFAGGNTGISPNNPTGKFITSTSDLLNQGVACLTDPNSSQCGQTHYPCIRAPRSDTGTCSDSSKKTCQSDSDCPTVNSVYYGWFDQTCDNITNSTKCNSGTCELDGKTTCKNDDDCPKTGNCTKSEDVCTKNADCRPCNGAYGCGGVMIQKDVSGQTKAGICTKRPNSKGQYFDDADGLYDSFVLSYYKE